MTSLIKAGRLVILPILLAGISLFLLQGCRQNEEAPPETAVSIPTINPTPASSAANQSIIVAPTVTSLPLPATATPLPASTTLPPSPTPSSQDTSHPTIGYSVQNRPIIAYLKGAGTKKLAFVGGKEIALS